MQQRVRSSVREAGESDKGSGLLSNEGRRIRQGVRSSVQPARDLAAARRLSRGSLRRHAKRRGAALAAHSRTLRGARNWANATEGQVFYQRRGAATADCDKG